MPIRLYSMLLIALLCPIASRANCASANKIIGHWQPPIIYRMIGLAATLNWQKNDGDTYNVIVRSDKFNVDIRAIEFRSSTEALQTLFVSYNEQSGNVPVRAYCENDAVIISFDTDDNKTLTLGLGVEDSVLATVFDKVNNNSGKQSHFEVGLVRN